jgi:hypothetical protein
MTGLLNAVFISSRKAAAQMPITTVLERYESFVQNAVGMNANSHFGPPVEGSKVDTSSSASKHTYTVCF